MADKILNSLNFGGEDTYYYSWKNLIDKPFGYETPTGGDTLKWDGNTNGLEGVMGILYRVHEATPTVKEGTVEINSSGTVTSTPFTVEDKNDGVQFLIANNVAIAVIVPTDGITVDGLKFNKAGIYLRKSGSEYVSALTIKDCEEFVGVKTLDYKYLPKSLRFGSDGVKTVEILPLTTEFVTGDDDGDGVDDMFALPNMLQGIEDGKTYTVTYNGTAYECVAKYYSIEGLEMYVLGNFDLSTGIGDTGEPFVISSLTTQEDVESFGTGVMISPLGGSIPTSLAISYETENITPIKTKYLPEHLQFGVEEGSGGVSEILPPTQMTLGDEINEGAMMSMHILANAVEGVVVGQTYTVNYNGTDYTCDAKEFTEGELTATTLGNLSLLLGTENTGEPFGLIILPPEQISTMGFGVMLYSFDVATSVTLSILGETIKKLDNKYLDLDWIPKAIKTKEVVFDDNLDFTKTKGFTYNEVLFDILPNEEYIVDWGGEEYRCVGTSFSSGFTVYQLGNRKLSALYGENAEDTGEPFLFEYGIAQGLLYLSFKIRSTVNYAVYVQVIGPKLAYPQLPKEYMGDTFGDIKANSLTLLDNELNSYQIYFNINRQMIIGRNVGSSSESYSQVVMKNDLEPLVFTTRDMQTVTCNLATSYFYTAYSNFRPHYFVVESGSAKNVYLISKIELTTIDGGTAYLYYADVEGSKVTITAKGSGTNVSITMTVA